MHSRAPDLADSDARVGQLGRPRAPTTCVRVHVHVHVGSCPPTGSPTGQLYSVSEGVRAGKLRNAPEWVRSPKRGSRGGPKPKKGSGGGPEPQNGAQWARQAGGCCVRPLRSVSSSGGGEALLRAHTRGVRAHDASHVACVRCVHALKHMFPLGKNMSF